MPKRILIGTVVSDKTDKRVSLKWYPGGVQGDERDYVRKINLGQLDGAAVTSVGLSMIDESIRVLELPRLLEEGAGPAQLGRASTWRAS